MRITCGGGGLAGRQRTRHCGTLDLHTITRPSLLSIRTSSPSRCAVRKARAARPAVVSSPPMSKTSLTLMGTPSNAPSGAPAARRASDARASASADENSSCVTALSAHPTASTLSQLAYVSASLVTEPERSAADIAPAEPSSRRRARGSVAGGAGGDHDACAAARASLRCAARLRSWDALMSQDMLPNAYPDTLSGPRFTASPLQHWLQVTASSS